MRRIEVYDAKNGGLVRYALAVKPYLGCRWSGPARSTLGRRASEYSLSAGLALRILVSLNSCMMVTSRVLSVSLPSAWLRFGGCSIALRKRTANVPGPSSVPAMYPERPDGHGGVRTAPGRKCRPKCFILFCEGYGASADARGRIRTGKNRLMVSRGGFELSPIGLKFRYFSNVDFPVYPLMYPGV
jgi:hypothetical protein